MGKTTPSGKGRWAKRKNRYMVKEEIYGILKDMLEAGMGTSKYKDKLEGGDFSKIYSFNTYETYHMEEK